MIDAYYPTIEQLVARKRTNARFLLILTLLTSLLIFGTMIALHLLMPRMDVAVQIAIAAAIFITVATPVMIWNNPRLGVYIIFGACCMLEFDPRGAPAKNFTTYVPFFLNYNNIGSWYHTSILEPIKFCPAEQFIGLAFLSWLIRSIAKREFRFRPGAFLPCILCYIGFVTLGFIHGLATGGEFLLALWEVRPQFLFLAAYLLTSNLITERKHLITLFWIAICGVGLRGLLGIQAYAELAGHITDQGILAHDDSLMFNILFFVPILLWFTNGPKKLIWFALLLLPPALFADLENNRRGGIAAFIIAFIALLPIMWGLMPERRKQIRFFVIGASLFSAVYLPAAWHSQGAWAFPARAIRSQSDPDARDAASDAYRVEEDADLKYTRDTAPWTGFGYGKAWIEIIPLPKVTGNGFLQVVAHDSVLWVWMRLGHLGFFCFMMMIVTILIRGIQITGQTRDPVTRSMCVLAILFTLMTYIYGKYDLQYVCYRSMIFLGLLVGILGNGTKLDGQDDADANPKARIASIPETDDEFAAPALNFSGNILDSSVFDRK